MSSETEENEEFSRWPRLCDERLKEFSESLDFLGLRPHDLAIRLGEIGDRRDEGSRFDEIEAVHRGEKDVPEELLATLELLKRQNRRIKRAYSGLNWYAQEDGTVRAFTNDFALRLLPESDDRYRVHLEHISGYKPKWPKWAKPLEEAKLMALLVLDDSLSYVDANPDMIW